jgi:uncharacterized membrane protein YhaH (DUF805 family)
MASETVPRYRRRFLGIRGRLSPRKYLGYSLLLAIGVAAALYGGVWLLAAVAKSNGWAPDDTPFRMLATLGAATIGALALWSMTALSVKRARDARIPTLSFKAGVPAVVLLDHFGVTHMTHERLAGAFDAFTPVVLFVLAGVFLFLLSAPRAPIKPLHADGEHDADMALTA